ncbi:hypothetical protein [Arvimicrobium flavum]|uniref:hypothetical protein n=1 Tax=Arvimicrobium flavum TaxID=3393320 RepID=UPI00237B39B7|nr:hypothetical protein [Mesorhizobium shangrilense]
MASVGELRQMVTATIDTLFAERVLLSFLNKERVDESRPAREISAKLVLGVESADGLFEGRRQGDVVAITGRRSQLFIDRTAYPDLMVRKGDKVRALEMAGQPWFAVSSVDGRHPSRLVLELGDT